MSNTQSVHVSVLLHEVVAYLAANKPLWYLDGTLGGAGHALALAQALEGNLNIIGFDRDPQAISRAQTLLHSVLTTPYKLVLSQTDYRTLATVLDAEHITGVDSILFDLGLSSDELDTSGRGFSFQKDEPLLMTFGEPGTYPFTATDIINRWNEEDIANVIFGYGEERFARRIARTIVAYREKKKIETASELAEIVRSSVPAFYRRAKTHPATKTFQALRIAVNDELGALRQGLTDGYERLNPGGRMAVISFHSLEDRIVKDFYKQKAKQGAIILTKKPVRPGSQEQAENPRSRSAKLRVIQKNP